MADLSAAHLALRTRLLTLSVCTTGSTSLSATTGGYARASGSFVADGFAVGMELTASGFVTSANNGAKVVTAVSASALSVDGGCSAEVANTGRTLAVGLPALRAWENVALEPVNGRPFLEEDFVPANATLRGLIDGGVLEDTGLYVLRWYGLADRGSKAIADAADALLALFAPGTGMTSSASETITVRGDVAPSRSQIRADLPGYALVTVTVPWRLYTLTPVS